MTLFCKCMNLDGTCPNEHYADTPEGRASEGFRSPTSGYGEVTVILGAHGPQIQGEIPNRIGVDRQVLTEPASGAWSMIDG